MTEQTGTFVASGDPNLATLQVAYAPNVDVPVIGQWVYALVAPSPRWLTMCPSLPCRRRGRVSPCNAMPATLPARCG